MGETHTSFIHRHTSSWYSHPSGVTVLRRRRGWGSTRSRWYFN